MFDQALAREQLKKHFLADGQQRYLSLEKAARLAKAALDKVDVEKSELTKEIETKKRELRQHGPAADVINRLIQCYLGHKELEIATLDTGYKIPRNGDPVYGSLSEGEKTAISLCYFISMIEAEGRRLRDLIVVVDDPISSLDTKALNEAAMTSGALLLKDYPSKSVRLAWRQCERAGQYRKAGLVARFGPDARMPDVLVTLAGCRARGDYSRSCGAAYPDLLPPSRTPQSVLPSKPNSDRPRS